MVQGLKIALPEYKLPIFDKQLNFMCLNLHTKPFKEVLYGVCKVGPLTSRVYTQPFINFFGNNSTALQFKNFG